jgi:hypothetical protein
LSKGNSIPLRSLDYILLQRQMKFLSSLTAITNSLDVHSDILKRFHVPDTYMLEYVQLIKELYKNLLQFSNQKEKHLYDLKSFFEQFDSILRLLFGAGGDLVITPRVCEFEKSVRTLFDEDMIMEGNVKILLKQLEWILNKTGAVFQIETMRSLKIDEI